MSVQTPHTLSIPAFSYYHLAGDTKCPLCEEVCGRWLYIFIVYKWLCKCSCVSHKMLLWPVSQHFERPASVSPINTQYSHFNHGQHKITAKLQLLHWYFWNKNLLKLETGWMVRTRNGNDQVHSLGPTWEQQYSQNLLGFLYHLTLPSTFLFILFSCMPVCLYARRPVGNKSDCLMFHHELEDMCFHRQVFTKNISLYHLTKNGYLV